MKLFPGMTAYITIPVADASSALRVPNGALRYKPDMTADQVRALYKQYGLTSGQQTGTQSAGAAGNETGSGDTGAAGKQRRARSEGTQGGGGGGGETGQQQHAPRADVAVVWKLRPDKTLEPVRIRTGITDHTVTEVAQVLKGQLNEGDELVTGGMAASSGAARAPGLGGGPPRTR
jgi:HlyD family secretion protein